MKHIITIALAASLAACASYQPIVDPKSKFTTASMADLPVHTAECRALASGGTEAVTDAMGNVAIGAGAGAIVAYAGASSITIPALAIGSGPIAPFVVAGAILGAAASESTAEIEAPMVEKCLVGRGYGVIGSKKTYEVTE